MRADKSIEQFERLFTKTDSCWVWHGDRHRLGYGIVTGEGRKREVAHRVAYRFYNGDFPKHLAICHTCDNPSCVNPDHLFVGTQRDNIRDMIHKGRRAAVRMFGNSNPKSIYSPEQVLKMREMSISGIRTCEIHKAFGGSYQSIWSIIKNKTWTHINP